MYYPTVVQPTSTGIWPNTYQIPTQQQQTIPTVYYQVPSMAIPSIPTTTVPEVIVQQQQSVPTVYYQPPTVTVPPIPTTTTSEVNVQQLPTNTTTTSKTVTTRILDPTNVIPTTQTTVTSIPTTTTVVPTTIHERPHNHPYNLRTFSTSTYSDDTTTSATFTITPQPTEILRQQPILPPQIPIQTTAIAPVHRVVHQTHRSYTPSGYYSSDLDYGRRKIYKTDYKYRHYYCCNVCKGRCDLHNRSYSCCEWFYGCPVWSLIFCALLFLCLLVAFFTLFGLQPTLNSSRRSATAETRLLNRTKVIYGFYQNCGYDVNATSNTATTLILCTNTGTTTTAPIELSPYYTVINQTNICSYWKILILFCYLFVLKINLYET